MFDSWGVTNVNNVKKTSLSRTRSGHHLPHILQIFLWFKFYENDFKAGRDLSFLGRVQIAYHPLNSHCADSESVKEDAELDFRLVKIQFSKGGLGRHRLTVGIQGLGEQIMSMTFMGFQN